MTGKETKIEPGLPGTIFVCSANAQRSAFPAKENLNICRQEQLDSRSGAASPTGFLIRRRVQQIRQELDCYGESAPLPSGRIRGKVLSLGPRLHIRDFATFHPVKRDWAVSMDSRRMQSMPALDENLTAADETASLLVSAPRSFAPVHELGGWQDVTMAMKAKNFQMETLLETATAPPAPPSHTSGEGSRKICGEHPVELEPGQSTKSSQEQRETTRLQFLLVYLYCSHFLARWGHSMWDFAAALFMIDIWPKSLVLGAIYGLVESASVVTFGVPVGNWVDKTAHLKVLQISLAVGNGSIMAAGVAVVVLLLHLELAARSFPAFVALVSCVNIFGGLSRLGLLATDIVVERDWVIVISEQYGEENGSALLSRMNAVMRRIDLSCKLLAPVAVGFLMSTVSVTAAAVVIAAWNTLTVGLQFYFLSRVYWRIPALQARNACQEEHDVLVRKSGATNTTKYARLDVASDDEDVDGVASESCGSRLATKVSELSFIKGWDVYWRQEIVLAAVSLAILYFTVLSFGPLMTAVLQLKGVPPYVLGLARGVAALVGIAGTVAYPPVHAQLDTVRTGLWAIWIQWSFLCVSLASIWVSRSTFSAAMLMGGVAASRLGLWMFDLAVTQLMQESVNERERGVVGGFQNALQSSMVMVTYIVTMFISRPQDFWIPICLSYAAVTTAATLYAIHTHRARGHLVHVERLSWIVATFNDCIRFIFRR